VHLYIDDVCFSGNSDFPYQFTIPAGYLSIGNYSIKATACNNFGKETESKVTISIVETNSESPDFVSFSDGKLPKGWKSNGWIVDPTFGYDDFNSLYTKTDGATVTTTKTCNYFEFYFYLEHMSILKFYIDDVLWYETNRGEFWSKYFGCLSDSIHTFRWVLSKSLAYPNSISGNIDAIRFETR
jgi:hypothetical protein